jgi:hypothetical protein
MDNLAKEITILSDAYGDGIISLDIYYALCDVLIALYKMEGTKCD